MDKFDEYMAYYVSGLSNVQVITTVIILLSDSALRTGSIFCLLLQFTL